MNRFSTAFVISVLLHVGLFLLVYVSWTNTPKLPPVSSVPVELVSSVPTREQAEAPVDELAVKTPEPEPAPEEPVKVEPKVEPAPKLPVPVPQKPVAKAEPKPEKKPDPKAQAKTPPDKNGLKKSEPKKDAKPSLDLNALSQLGASPSKSKTRNPAQANTRKTDGASNRGTSPADTGAQTALTALTRRLQPLWNPNCDVPGARLVSPEIAFMISPNGRVIQGPEWINKRNDAIWQAAASRAMSAVKRGELYSDLPKELYNVRLEITFDGQTACPG